MIKIEYFYKYRKPLNLKDEKELDYVKRIFTHSEIYVPRAYDFNDPFDSRFLPSYEGTPDELFEYFINELEKDGDLNDSNRQEWEQRVRLGIREHSNNPQMFEGILEKQCHNLINKFGIFCLSTENNNLLMWSHYTDAHKGFCLQFKAIKTPLFIGSEEVLQQVIYINNYPDLNRLILSDEELAGRMFLTKSTCWSYENEYRVIERSFGTKSFTEHLLSGVIFGCQMRDENKDMIIKWSEGRKAKLNYFEAKKKDKEFGLYIVPTTID